MKNGNKYNESNAIGVLGIILTVGMYIQFIKNEIWNSAEIIIGNNLIYFITILSIMILSMAFWTMSLGYILLNFMDFKLIIKNTNQKYSFRRSKHFLALCLILLFIASLLYYDSKSSALLL